MEIAKNWKKVSLVVAADRKGGIGFQGQLPWPYLSKEMKHFAEVTSDLRPMAFSKHDWLLKSGFIRN